MRERNPTSTTNPKPQGNPISFTFHVPTKVLFGPGTLKKLHEEQLPGKKALVVISNGKSVRANGYLAALEAELDAAGVAHVLAKLRADLAADPEKEKPAMMYFLRYKTSTPHMIESLRLAPMRPLDPSLFPDVFRKTP